MFFSLHGETSALVGQQCVSHELGVWGFFIQSSKACSPNRLCEKPNLKALLCISKCILAVF